VDKVDGTKMTVLLGVTPCILAERYQIDSYIRQSYNIQPARRRKQQLLPKLWYHPPNCRRHIADDIFICCRGNQKTPKLL